MRTALIGYTGFVGCNLSAAYDFDDRYNTRNVEEIRNRSYDLVVSAAGRADSHRINLNPADDRAEIDAYVDLLSTVKTPKLVVISTVCVYPGASSPTEATQLTDADLTPYGVNRLRMERQLSERFDALVVRLPQLYGRGVKKGIVYDLLNDYRVEYIEPTGLFQYYDLGRLWSDVQVALQAGLPALNVATPPLTSARVAADCFGIDIADHQPVGDRSPLTHTYTRDMRTMYADLFGGPPGYLMDETATLNALREFVRAARSATASAPST
jgi:hypothetical protein